MQLDLIARKLPVYIYRHMLTVEFTIEPFVEGDPGPHVTAAVAAVEAHGIAVDFGPFGSLFSVDAETLPVVIADLLRVAYGNGATFVNVSVSRFDS
jgi:uncharacterized protein YqgV (UPF0045/DUF77 family)